jgi:hypothetical protein
MHALGELFRQYLFSQDLEGRSTGLLLFVAGSSYLKRLRQSRIRFSPDANSLKFFNYGTPYVGSNSDLKFMAAIPIISDCCGLPIPHLQATAADVNQNPHGLYTSETYIEYQQVLSALLTRFKDSLVELGEHPNPKTEGYERRVIAVATYGSFLTGKVLLFSNVSQGSILYPWCSTAITCMEMIGVLRLALESLSR